MKNVIKNGIKFATIMLPFAAIGGFFAGRYSFATMSADMQQMLLAEIGSVNVYATISMVQSAMYAIVCGILGYLLAEKTGLLKNFGFQKKEFAKTVITAALCGVVFSLDYWIFGAWIPQVAESYQSEITIRSVDNWIASVLYGGIIEELMLRFFLMSLLVFIIWKLFFKRWEKEAIPVIVFVIANGIAALVFAAGHLPATILAFGELSFLIVLRCFVLNGLFGFIFGEIYRKYGIQYAIVGHMGTHIVSKLIWLVLL